MIPTLAYTACAILVGLSLFQLALITGQPLGRFAWGGSHTVLPVGLRRASMFSIVLYSIFGIIILEAANIINLTGISSFSTMGIWALTVYFSFGVILNAISRSKPERLLMTPIALILAVLCYLIASQ